MAKTVIVKGHNYTRKEAIAAEAITPGAFVERITAGTVQQRDAVTAVPALIAMENEVVGQDIETAYASGDTTLLASCGTGTEINAILADSQTITIGEALECVAGGMVVTAAGTNAVVGVALEAVTTSGSTSRILIELV